MFGNLSLSHEVTMGIYYNSAQGACLNSNYNNIILRVSLSFFFKRVFTKRREGEKRFYFNFEITPDDSYVPTLLC